MKEIFEPLQRLIGYMVLMKDFLRPSLGSKRKTGLTTVTHTTGFGSATNERDRPLQFQGLL